MLAYKFLSVSNYKYFLLQFLLLDGNDVYKCFQDALLSENSLCIFSNKFDY